MRLKIGIGGAIMACLFLASSSLNRVWQSGTIEDPALDEVSGLAASSVYKDIYWAMNDSANAAILFAIDKAGKTHAKVTVTGGPYRDIEALAYGDCAFAPKCIYIADIGDNGRERRRVRILIVREPNLSDTKAEVLQTIYINYADCPKNAEAIMIRPIDGAIFIIEKLGRKSKRGNPRIFLVPKPKTKEAEAQIDAVPIAQIETKASNAINLGSITDASFLNSGSGFFIRDYSNVFFIEDPLTNNKALRLLSISSPFMRQSEAIAVSNNDRELVITSEGRHSIIKTIKIRAPINGK